MYKHILTIVAFSLFALPVTAASFDDISKIIHQQIEEVTANSAEAATGSGTVIKTETNIRANTGGNVISGKTGSTTSSITTGDYSVNAEVENTVNGETKVPVEVHVDTDTLGESFERTERFDGGETTVKVRVNSKNSTTSSSTVEAKVVSVATTTPVKNNIFSLPQNLFISLFQDFVKHWISLFTWK